MTAFASLSVIVPVFNGCGHLPALLSDLGAVVEDHRVEAVLVDDGSTDETYRILGDFARQRANVQVVSQPNRGVGLARNAGLSVSRGRYVWFVDSDDSILPDACSQIISLLGSERSDILEFGYEICGREFHPVSEITRWDRERTRLNFCRPLACRGRNVFVWNRIYGAHFVRSIGATFPPRIGGSHGGRNEDFRFNLRCCISADSYTLLPLVAYSYRPRAGSLSRSYSREMILELRDAAGEKNRAMVALGFSGLYYQTVDRLWMARQMFNVGLVMVATSKNAEWGSVRLAREFRYTVARFFEERESRAGCCILAAALITAWIAGACRQWMVCMAHRPKGEDH